MTFSKFIGGHQHCALFELVEMDKNDSDRHLWKYPVDFHMKHIQVTSTNGKTIGGQV